MGSFRLLIAVAILCSAAIAQNQTSRAPVLVELYTSEGCSSCPPVDKQMADLQKQQPLPDTEIVLLGFHVDYWNYDGWTDRFSSPQFTKRQENYSARSADHTTYTPQIIIDGVVRPFDPSATKSDIKSAAKKAKPIFIALHSSQPGAVEVGLGPHPAADFFLAITEDDLQTEVKAGENGGRLPFHSSVGSQLISFGDNGSPVPPPEALGFREPRDTN